MADYNPIGNKPWTDAEHAAAHTKHLASQDKVHVFELAGLGRAPFKLVDIVQKVGPLLISTEGGVEHWAGAPGQPMGVCRYCGTGILNCCVIQSADGKLFDVGTDCVYKVGDAGLVSRAKKILARRNTEARHAREEKRITWARENLPRVQAAWRQSPHPYAYMAQDGKTRWDWATWMLANGGTSAKMKVAKALEQALSEEKKRHE